MRRVHAAKSRAPNSYTLADGVLVTGVLIFSSSVRHASPGDGVDGQPVLVGLGQLQDGVIKVNGTSFMVLT
jgi:hypothetical protein